MGIFSDAVEYLGSIRYCECGSRIVAVVQPSEHPSYLRFLPCQCLGTVDLDGTIHRKPDRADREDESQPLPTKNDAPDIQSMVIADIEARRQVGIKRYGTALQPNNGRNALLDAYEEAIDLAMYLKQRLVEEGQ